MELLEPPWLKQFHFNDGSVQETLRGAMKAIIPEANGNGSVMSSVKHAFSQDPVSTIHGRAAYERETIEAWFRHSRTDPLTGERLLTT